MKQLFFGLIAVSLFWGCTEERGEPLQLIKKSPSASLYPAVSAEMKRESESKIEIAKLQSSENIEKAKIEAKSREEIKRIESDALKAQAQAQKAVGLQAQQTQKEIALLNSQVAKETQGERLTFYKIALALFVLLVLIALLLYFFIHRKNKMIELRLQEERQRHEAAIQASAHRHQNIGKMLEIIADKDIDEKVRCTLVEILQNQESSLPLVAYENIDEAGNKGE